MEQLRVVKKQLVLDLDKNEAPTAWRWRVDRFVKFDDGSEKIVPDEIPATAEEVQDHIGAAVGKQAVDIENDRKERETERAAANGIARKLADAEGKLARIAQADAQYDANVKPLFAEPEQTKQ